MYKTLYRLRTDVFSIFFCETQYFKNISQMNHNQSNEYLCLTLTVGLADGYNRIKSDKPMPTKMPY